MMDVITGKTRPDAGKVFLGQTIDLARMNPEIARAGIGRKFQKPTVFEQHPVWRTSNSRCRPTRAGSRRCAQSSIARAGEIEETLAAA